MQKTLALISEFKNSKNYLEIDIDNGPEKDELSAQAKAKCKAKLR